MKGWGAVLVSAGAELIFFTEKITPYKPLRKELTLPWLKPAQEPMRGVHELYHGVSVFCSPTTVPALDVWGQRVLPAPLPWFWAPAEGCSVPGW